ncbi:MAG: DNA polymerase I [Breznakibacter sp.]|nr:DNA polymerase I [Breznakibacter sp.]
MSSNKPTLYLIDAYALIFRAYYAFIRAPRINSKGVNTSAVFGFVNMLLEVLSKEKPSHIAVAFDPSGPTFRHEQFEAYKAHRDETPEEIRKSVPIIKDFLKAMNIPVLQVEGYEADDVIGTLSKIGSENGFFVKMMTPDKDYAQLVNESVVMIKPKSMGNEVVVWGVDEVNENFNTTNPLQVIDILGLWGDSADNIPGCPGIGEKTSKDLISKYGSIDGIYEHIDELKGKQKENLINFKEQVYLSRHLATICLEVPITFEPERYVAESPNREELVKLFNELEFRGVLTRVNDLFFNAPKPAQRDLFSQGSLFDEPAAATTSVKVEDAPKSIYKTIKEVDHQYIAVKDKSEIAKLIEDFTNCNEFCFDTETTGLDVMGDELVGISLCKQKGVAYYIPVPPKHLGGVDFVKQLAPIFTNPNTTKIGQNIKFDYLMLKRYNVEVAEPFFDTMIADHLVNPIGKHGMDAMSENYLQYSPISIDELIGAKGKDQKSMRSIPLAVISDYASEDADVTFQLKEILFKRLKENNLVDYANSVEFPLLKVLAKMEYEGVFINSQELEAYSKELTLVVLNLEKEIYAQAGMEFNIGSPKQVGEVLFDHLNIDPLAKTTKTGQYSTGEEVLEKLKGKHPIIDLILKYRGLKKLISTYIDALPKLVNFDTQRIHTSYNQAIVVTGRISSTNPNLQNIPVREEEGREIRRAFLPQHEGFTFLSADYSQIELRLMAHFSADEAMIEAFNKGEDIHTATASKIFGVSLAEVTSDMRRKAKMANFGIIYGISPFGLAERLSIPRSEAKALIDGYFANFPGVKKYMDGVIQSAQETGVVETLSGRKRQLPDIFSKNQVVRGMAERNAINAPIQGTAADIIKMAMVKIDRVFEKEQLKSKMIMQVHDELNFEVYLPELDRVKAIVKEEMESAVSLKVPLLVEMGSGKNWLEAH